MLMYLMELLIQLRNLDEIELKLKEHIEEIKLTKEFTPDMREDMQKCNFCGFKLLCKRGEFLNG